MRADRRARSAPTAGWPSVAGQGFGHRPLGDDGPRARPRRFPTFPHGFPAGRDRRVRAPHRPGDARQQGRVGHGDHRRARRRSTCAPARRSSTRRPTACSRSPRTKRSFRSTSSIASARSPSSSSARGMGVGRVIARPFVGAPGHVHAHREPPRLRAAAVRADAARSADGRRPAGRRRSARSRICSPAAASRARSTRAATTTGWTRSSSAMATTPRGLIFANLVDFDTAVRPSQRRRRLRREPRALRRAPGGAAAAAAPTRSADRHRRSRQRSDDAEHRSFARVRAAARRRRRACARASISARDRRSPISARRSPTLRRRPARARHELPARDRSWSTTRRIGRPTMHVDHPRTARSARARDPGAAGREERRRRRAALRPEPEDPIRPAFQRDRDRIIHCKAFRRLKHKTQVFFAPTGDHYRTRLTHTLEVSQIARSIAKVLRLNEELTEAIALGHDLGHTPFGHAGERVLDSARARRLQPLRAEPAHRRRARERRRRG